jgi:hypothetical protein
MPIQKLKYGEGDWFSVPLRDQRSYAVGLIARLDGLGGVLGYFFGSARLSVPNLDELCRLQPVEAILIRRFSDLGIQRNEWGVIGKCNDWQRKDWPVPLFARTTADGVVAWVSEYSDGNGMSLVQERQITLDEVKKFPEDGSSGYGAIEIRLTKLLLS